MMMVKPVLSAVDRVVRRDDPDRFFTALFAPVERRETLFTLYAFNSEVARACDSTREPYAAMIRLQWWRDVVEGARPRHEIAGPVGDALETGALRAGDLLRMIDAREAELDPPRDQTGLIGYVEGTAGWLAVTAARVLGWDEPEGLLRPAAAYGICGLVRTFVRTPDARRASCIPGGDVDGVRRLAQAWLDTRVRVPRHALAAALPIAMARSRLRNRECAGTGRWAAVRAAMTGRP